MAKKINSVELEKIIAEEVEKALVDEGFFSRVKAGWGPFKGGYAAKKQEEENNKKLVKIVGLIGDYIQANRTNREVMNAIKGTEIFKKLGLMEALPSSYEAELQAKGVNQDDVNKFLEAVKDIQSAKDFFKELLPQSAAQPASAQPASAQPAAGQPASAQPAAGQAAVAQQTPTDQTQPAAAQPATGQPQASKPAQKIRFLPPIEDKPQAQDEPAATQPVNPEDKISTAKRPSITTIVTDDNINKARLQYNLLNKEKNIGLTNLQVDSIIDILANNKMIYLRDTDPEASQLAEQAEPEQEKPKEVKEYTYQTMGVKTIRALKQDPRFTKTVESIVKFTSLPKDKVLNFLIAVWQEGKLIKPVSQEIADVQIEKDREEIMGQQAVDESLSESRRWQKLAGILKD